MATTTRQADEIMMSQQVHEESTTQQLVNESTCAWRVRPRRPNESTYIYTITSRFEVWTNYMFIYDSTSTFARIGS